MTENENAWVEVSSCTWPHEAHFLRSVLEAADIEVLLPDEYTLGVDPSLVPALHGVRVLVHSVDLQRAGEVIDSAKHGPSTSVHGKGDVPNTRLHPPAADRSTR